MTSRLWARHLASAPQRSGKAEPPASVARRLSWLSSFYGYRVEADVLEVHTQSGVRARARSVTGLSSFRSTRAVAGAGAALVAAGAALVAAGTPTLHLLSVRENPVAGHAEGSDVPPGGVA